MKILMIPGSMVRWKECRPMERRELMSKIRADLRERPNSHFSEIYFRVTANKVSSTEVHNAFCELLKRMKSAPGAVACVRNDARLPELWNAILITMPRV